MLSNILCNVLYSLYSIVADLKRTAFGFDIERLYKRFDKHSPVIVFCKVF